MHTLWPKGMACSHAEWAGSRVVAGRKAARWRRDSGVESIEMILEARLCVAVPEGGLGVDFRPIRQTTPFLLLSPSFSVRWSSGSAPVALQRVACANNVLARNNKTAPREGVYGGPGKGGNGRLPDRTHVGRFRQNAIFVAVRPAGRACSIKLIIIAETPHRASREGIALSN